MDESEFSSDIDSKTDLIHQDHGLGIKTLTPDNTDHERNYKLRSILSIFFQTAAVSSNESLVADCLQLIDAYCRQNRGVTLAPVATAVGIYLLRESGVPLKIKSICARLSLSFRLVARVLRTIDQFSPRPARSPVNRALDALASLAPKFPVAISADLRDRIEKTLILLVTQHVILMTSLHCGVLAVMIYAVREVDRTIVAVRPCVQAAELPLSTTYHALKSIESYFARASQEATLADSYLFCVRHKAGGRQTPDSGVSRRSPRKQVRLIEGFSVYMIDAQFRDSESLTPLKLL